MHPYQAHILFIYEWVHSNQNGYLADAFHFVYVSWVWYIFEYSIFYLLYLLDDP